MNLLAAFDWIDTTITLGSVLLAVIISAATITNIWFGGRKWKTNYEAEHVDKERWKTKAVEREQERDSLKSIVDTLGGANVLQAVTEFQTQSGDRYAEALVRVADMFEGHERRAEDRHRVLLEAHVRSEERMTGIASSVALAVTELTEAVDNLKNGT